MERSPQAPQSADESREVAVSAVKKSASMSQVRPVIPAAARVPAEASALVDAAEPEPLALEEELSGLSAPPQPVTRSNFPSLPPSLARVGRYDVVGRIAVGGMAEIYLAHENVETGAVRRVVIKVLKGQAGAPREESYFEELFMREGRTAAQLVHPNICHVYEFGTWAGYFYIAMEWIDGFSLRHVLSKLARRKKTMPPLIAVGIAAQIAGALQYAHNVRDARGRPLAVVHLDVNPQNIMLRHDGVVKLLDFGIAQVADPRGDTRSDSVKGKIGYIAPEQVRQQTLDRRVDVFGLGACLFEMLTGRAAYPRESLRESVEALLTQPTPSLHTFLPELPGELDEIVQKALAREPRERFQTAGELQAALEGFLARSREVVSGRHIAKLMESITPSLPDTRAALYTGPEVVSRLAPVTGEQAVANSGIEFPASTTPHKAVRIAVAALVVLLFALTAYLTSGPSEAPSAAPAIAAPTPLPPRGPAPLERPIAPPEAPAAARTEAPPQAAIEAPKARPVPSAPKVKRANRRRVKPGFVADPGF